MGENKISGYPTWSLQEDGNWHHLLIAGDKMYVDGNEVVGKNKKKQRENWHYLGLHDEVMYVDGKEVIYNEKKNG